MQCHLLVALLCVILSTATGKVHLKHNVQSEFEGIEKSLKRLRAKTYDLHNQKNFVAAQTSQRVKELTKLERDDNATIKNIATSMNKGLDKISHNLDGLIAAKSRSNKRK